MAADWHDAPDENDADEWAELFGEEMPEEQPKECVRAAVLNANTYSCSSRAAINMPELDMNPLQ